MFKGFGRIEGLGVYPKAVSVFSSQGQFVVFQGGDEDDSVLQGCVQRRHRAGQFNAAP